VFGAATIDLGGVGYVGITQGVPASISATGHRYRWGRIAVRPVGPTQMDVVIDMTIEQWMYGLAEIPASWPAAALEAQAIAGRTFGAYRQRHPRASTYQADSVAGDGYYVGYDHEVSSSADRWIQAVDRTAGRILLWGGSPIQALYSSSNGGYSEVAEYVFASRLPYLTAAPDPYDDAAGNPNRRWTERYSGRELQAWIRARGHPDVGPVVGVDVLGGRGASGRVDRATVNIRGTLGSTRLTGNELRAAINAGASSDRDLRSTRFFVAGGIPAGDDPVGGLDLVRRGPGGIAVAGWAADPDAPEEQLLVLVYVDGRLAGAGRADGASTAVSGGVAGFDANHGFATVVAAPDGPTRLCVAAVNVGPGTSRLLACQTVVK
jgi:stage II sporulation protein D